MSQCFITLGMEKLAQVTFGKLGQICGDILKRATRFKNRCMILESETMP